MLLRFIFEILSQILVLHTFYSETVLTTLKSLLPIFFGLFVFGQAFCPEEIGLPGARQPFFDQNGMPSPALQAVARNFCGYDFFPEQPVPKNAWQKFTRRAGDFWKFLTTTHLIFDFSIFLQDRKNGFLRPDGALMSQIQPRDKSLNQCGVAQSLAELGVLGAAHPKLTKGKEYCLVVHSGEPQDLGLRINFALDLVERNPAFFTRIVILVSGRRFAQQEFAYFGQPGRAVPQSERAVAEYILRQRDYVVEKDDHFVSNVKGGPEGGLDISFCVYDGANPSTESTVAHFFGAARSFCEHEYIFVSNDPFIGGQHQVLCEICPRFAIPLSCVGTVGPDIAQVQLDDPQFAGVLADEFARLIFALANRCKMMLRDRD